MKVLFNCNTIAFQSPGGGTVQLLKTKEYLEKNKINVKLFNQWDDKIGNYDIIHNFGKSNNCYDVIHSAKLQKVPIAITPIYNWPSLIYGLKENIGIKRKLKFIAYHIIKNNHLFDFISKTRIMLKEADIILPDSQAEAKLMIKHFNLDKRKIAIVPVGVEKSFKDAKKNLFIEKYGLKDFVLYVGRIEQRKNLIELIKIMNKINLPLVIIGNKVPDQINYYNICRKIAKKNIHFLGELEKDSKLLMSAYAATKVFVLPSFVETPGIATLEAGLAGANIVITERGSTREYFKNHVSYINPLNTTQIEKAIKLEYDKDKNRNLSKYIEKNFVWEVVIKKVIKAYQRIAL